MSKPNLSQWSFPMLVRAVIDGTIERADLDAEMARRSLALHTRCAGRRWPMRPRLDNKQLASGERDDET